MRKEDLEQKAIELNLDLDESITWTNDKLIRKLGEYYMPEDASWGTKYVHSLETPMLCKPLKNELKNFKTTPLEMEEYVAEFKCNGCRCLMVFDPEVGFQMFSRKESVTNFLNNDFTNKILFIKNGIVTKPEDYKGKFNLRFVLDGEITVDSADGSNDTDFEGNHYDTVEDFLQAVLGSLPQRAKNFQLEGKTLKFNIFDVLYFEKDPSPIPPEVSYNYNNDTELTKEEIEWVETHYEQYLITAGFTLGKRIPKLLYRYLYDLRKTSKYDLRRLPFYKRRQVRKSLVDYLQKANLPIVEVSGEDVFKISYLEEVLSEGGEGCFHCQTKVNMADGTYKRIDQVKEGDLVLSYNIDTEEVEAKPVTHVFYNGRKPVQQWYSVSHGPLQGTEVVNKQNKFHRIKCTTNHRFFDGNDFSEISNLDYCYEYDYVLDKYRKQALIGWVLSDATISKDNQIILTQRYNSLFWAFTQDMFKEFAKTVNKTRISGKGSLIGFINLYKYYTYNWAFKADDYSYLIDQMDEISLAYLIMGDGSANKRSVGISTESYSLNEVNKIIKKINDIIGETLTYSLYQDTRVKTGDGFSIRYTKESTDKILEKVGQYVHPSMLYKFGDRDYSNIKFKEPPELSKDIRKVQILKTPLEQYSNFQTNSVVGAWDLEVQDNHNYFVENVLVHNCVLKNLDAPYISALKSSRSHRACIKVKQSVKELMESSDKFDDFDVFITGANPPKSDRIKDMIGSLSCSIYMIDELGETVLHEIANVSGIPHEWKRELAHINEDGTIVLNPKYKDKVIAIDGMALSHNSLRFQHAVLKEKNGLVFKDKNPTDCVWQKEELEKMIIVRGRK